MQKAARRRPSATPSSRLDATWHSSRRCRTSSAFPTPAARSIPARCTSAARSAASPGGWYRRCHGSPGTACATGTARYPGWRHPRRAPAAAAA
ncbi:hypothetical protein G6F23_015923 [Rhizopus arrhizus]|nr:hypothetical protein G6F23_015923 [Rhizopus arrhizus]